MQIFDEIKNRGVEDVLFLSMGGVSGREEGARAIFPNVTVQSCIVHLIRNSIKYVPNKDYKRFTTHLKDVEICRFNSRTDHPELTVSFS